VYGYLPHLSIAIGAARGQEGNDYGPALGFPSHLQWIFWIFPDGKRPWIKGMNPKRRFTESWEKAICVSTREMAAELEGDLGFDLSPLFIAAGAIWIEIVQSTRIPQSTKMHWRYRSTCPIVLGTHYFSTCMDTMFTWCIDWPSAWVHNYLAKCSKQIKALNNFTCQAVGG
jgi:hypothetical protein